MSTHHGKILQIDGNYDFTDSEEEEDEDANRELTVNDGDEINADLQFKETCARFLLTNARSIKPKMASLLDSFGSLNLHFACITETWYAGGRELRDHIIDIEGAAGIKILHKSRDGRSKKRGGGVAIAFNSALCNFKQRQLKCVGKEHEVMCAVGKVGKIERKVVVMVVYIPPGMKAQQLQKLRENLAAEVSEAKVAYKNPIFVIGGDFNHRDVMGEVDHAEHMSVVKSGPTRGDSTIDLIYTNVPGEVAECRTLPPLESTTGAPSDHRCVYVAAEFKAQKKFEWVVKMRRLRNEERESAFARQLEEYDWGDLTSLDSVDDMWERVENAIRELTDQNFPLVRVRKRSNESPWITRGIRRLWKKKIRIYKKEGKSQAWWEVDRVLQERIEASRAQFVEKMLEQGTNGSSFYAATRKLAKAAVVPQWTVKDLYVGRRPHEICEEVLSYFGGVAPGPAPDFGNVMRIPGGLPEFTVGRTQDLLGAIKKSDSCIDGDPLPHLVRCQPQAFARPIAAIFNRINDTGTWPVKWKTEHLTIIPKNPNPADLSECRNISSTSIFSKILEGEVLAQLRRELLPDPSQYGGIPNCSAEYMLIDIWERILTALEGGTHAAVLLGVDYEKAFNRMRHDACLDQLDQLGATPGSISLVRAFLEGRTMTISIDGVQATPVPITRGSPQGSVLGCLLYCVTTQRLTGELRGPGGMDEPRYFPQTDSDEEEVAFWPAPNGADDPRPEAFLYVDDTTLFDRVPMESSTRHLTTTTTKEVFESLTLEGDFDRLSERAVDIGMKINNKKTQLLVISPSNGCHTSASITPRGSDTICSVDRMKLVGFTFGDSPSAGPHIETIEEMYKAKKWMLYHLRDAGIKGRLLYRLYCCYVRSSVEYCSAVYHALLNKGQEEQLEKLQRHALRICFGTATPVEEIMEINGIESLKTRRERRCDAFIAKAFNNPRFNHTWFPRRGDIPWNFRARRQVEEVRAATARRHNSPLAFMKRRVNELGLGRREGGR